MMKTNSLRSLANQKGVTLILVAFLMAAFIGFAAIAVDLAYLYIVKGELQNAADSGALAGAQVLYITDPLGVQVNAAANQTALDLVSANYRNIESFQDCRDRGFSRSNSTSQSNYGDITII